MRVLFITSWYPTRDSPLNGIYVRDHAKAVKLFDDVMVLHTAGSNSRLKRPWVIEEETDPDLTEGVLTYRVWHRLFHIPTVTYVAYLCSVFRAFRLTTVSKGFRPDIIHAQVFEAAVPAVMVGKIYGIPVVVSEHSSKFPRRLMGSFDVWKARFSFRFAKLVMPVSRFLQSAIEGYEVKARFLVVPNVGDTKLFFPNRDKTSGGNIKRLLVACLFKPSNVKGVPNLLNALAMLRREREDWHLDIIGDGPARGECECLAKKLGLAERVTFHGFKSKKELGEHMRKTDLFVVPSSLETFSVVAAEALLTGVPVITTRCGGPEEFVRQDVGLTVAPEDPGALCDGLNYMLDCLELFSRKHISEYALSMFAPERVGQKLHEIYSGECEKIE
jgi:glycosyltransferase involved in cell wall biosynthesis